MQMFLSAFKITLFNFAGKTTKYTVLMICKNTHAVLSVLLLLCSTVHAQEQAKYRVTYDCDAQIVTGKTNTYRWTLDIGETTAVFYNKNYRLYSRELAEAKANGTSTALMDQLPVIGQKYFPKNDLQIVIGTPEKRKYSYYKQLLTSGLKYEDALPSIEWQLTDSTKTICEYECKQAVGSVYGRTWTVWYSTELPLNYGPYILNGLPGLIMAAKDSDGLFDFKAVGIENAPEDALVSAYEEDRHQKCTRKRFLEIRSDSEGMSQDQLVNRILNQNSSGEKVIVYTVQGTDAKIDAKVEVPKYNHLDKE